MFEIYGGLYINFHSLKTHQKSADSDVFNKILNTEFFIYLNEKSNKFYKNINE